MAIKPSHKTNARVPLGLLDKVFVGILLGVFAGIVLHAPLTIGFGTLLPDFADAIKSWKEILMALAGVVMLVLLFQKKRWDILKRPLVLVIAGYALLHLLLLPVFWQGIQPSLAGLLIDLRYLLFFVLVYVAIVLYPSLRRIFVVAFFAGAFVVAAFALLQVFVLPNDILKYIGYNSSTIVPFMTVDENIDYIRINSTLRGPNPLGAYAVVVLAVLFAFWIKVRQVKPQTQRLAVSVIVVGSFVALWASYSRSALIAAFVAIAIIVLATVGRKFSRRLWIGIFVILFGLAGGLFAARDTYFVSNVILHENATTGAQVSSNDGHAESLRYGTERMLEQPLGGGIGSTGSASLYGSHPLIIENQFLFIAHEVGWIGLGIFIYLLYLVFRGLWQRRSDWLALGVLAGGIGLVVIGILLPVWVDETVAIVWWGLAAVVLGHKEARGNGRTSVKKAKRVI